MMQVSEKNLLKENADINKHNQTIHGSSQGKQTSEYVFVEDKDISVSFVDSEELPKNLCSICLFSFKLKDELKEHLQKHTERKKLPSILKKC